MPLAEVAAVFVAGMGAGAVNALAGGGTLLSFPLLVWLGRDPIVANATNALALWPGSVAGALGFRRELGGAGRLLALLVPAAAVGGWLGGAWLLRTPTAVFSQVVPYLVLAATLLVALQRPLLRLLGTDAPRAWSRRQGIALFLGQVVVSVYGGYFGAAMGILMLAAMGLAGIADIHRRNALKNVLSAVINGVAGVYFAVSGAVILADAVTLALGAVVGGYAGASLGRRMSRRTAELLVLVIGLAATGALFLR